MTPKTALGYLVLIFGLALLVQAGLLEALISGLLGAVVNGVQSQAQVVPVL